MINRFNNFIGQLRGKAITRRLNRNREQARLKLEANHVLWKTLTAYLSKTSSTGGEYSDYLALYDHVRLHRPKEILECGTGVSTIIMAFALSENEKEDGIKGRITSMEDKEKWLNIAQDLLPADLAPYVDLVLSPLVEDGWYFFRGIRYSELPDRKYEFVFVDGPDFVSPIDDKLTFDFDLIRVVEKSNHDVYAIVDDRLSSSFVYQKIFGTEKARYLSSHRLCFIGPVSQKDLRGMEAQKPCFIQSFRYFGESELGLNFQPLQNHNPK